MTSSNANHVATQRIVTTILIAISILAAQVLFQKQASVRDLQARRNELIARYEQHLDFAPSDPRFFKIIRVPHVDSHLIQFRVHCPPTAGSRIRGGVGFDIEDSPSANEYPFRLGGPSSIFNPKLELYFQLDERETQISLDTWRERVTWRIRDPLIEDLLRNHWDELEFEIAGESAPLEFADDQVCDFFQLRAPRNLLPADRIDEEADGVFVRFRIGSPAAFELEAKNRKGSPPP